MASQTSTTKNQELIQIQFSTSESITTIHITRCSTLNSIKHEKNHMGRFFFVANVYSLEMTRKYLMLCKAFDGYSIYLYHSVSCCSKIEVHKMYNA